MEPKTTVVCLGDSITHGYPYGPQASWVAQVCVPGVAFINWGVNGDTMEDMLRRLAADAIAADPTHVVVLGGTNDAFVGVGGDSYERVAVKILNRLLEAGITPVLGIPIPVDVARARRFFPGQDDQLRRADELLEGYRARLRQLAEEHGLDAIAFDGAFRSDSGQVGGDLLVDGVHPSREGYRAMAAYSEGALRSAVTARRA